MMHMKTGYGLFLAIMLMGVLVASTQVHKVAAPLETIYIRADGSIEPSTANIISIDNVTYTFTANINVSIVVEKSNIVIDGTGYTLQGPGTSENGITLLEQSNVTIQHIAIQDFVSGIHLSNSSNNTIAGNHITNNYWGIILQSFSTNNILTANTVSSNAYRGISSSDSDLNIISGNNITLNADAGIRLDSSSDSTISENLISENFDGIYLRDSSNITVSENNITGDSHDGIYLDSSSNNTIHKNVNSGGDSSQHSIVLWSGSHHNIVSENVLSSYFNGISIGYSDYNRILNNTVSNHRVSGIYLQQICNNSIIANNVVSDNSLLGIEIREDSEMTRYNVIRGNDILRNPIGIRINSMSGNVIYHNNFVDNTNQASISNSANIWDDGVEGNYWSSYTGVDLNHDGIGDTSHVMDADNIDYHPLMGAFQSFNTSLANSVNVISNSTVDSFQYESPGTIRFHVSNTTTSQTHGFCRVTIPDDVLSAPFNVTIDGATPTFWNYTLYDNDTHRWIYFEYTHSTREVVIVPEFPSFLSLLLFVTVTLTVALVYNRKRPSYHSAAPPSKKGKHSRSG